MIYARDDVDEGRNAEVRYRLRSVSGKDDYSYFGIRYNEETGKGHLYLAKKLKPRDGVNGQKYYNVGIPKNSN